MNNPNELSDLEAVDGGSGTDQINITVVPVSNSVSPFTFFENQVSGIESIVFEASLDAQGQPSANTTGWLVTYADLFNNNAISLIDVAARASDSVFELSIFMASETTIDLSSIVFGEGWSATQDFLSIIGDSDSETIVGTSTNDSINTGSGDDIVYGGLGADNIDTDWGRDEVFAGAGNDFVSVDGPDLVAGEIYDGGDGVDTLGIAPAFESVLDLRTSTVAGFERFSFFLFDDATIRLTSDQLRGPTILLADYQVESFSVNLEVHLADGDVFDASGITLGVVDRAFIDPNTYLSQIRLNFIGSSGGDQIAGSVQGDSIFGGDGNDRLDGGDGGYLTPVQWQVFRLYQATLGRAPDVVGFNDWSQRLSAGEFGFLDVVGAFTGSTEFQSLYGALDNAAFVTLLYQNVLGRQPDPSGLQNWLNALNAGVSRAEIVRGFSDSVEFIQNTEYAAAAWATFELRGDMEGQVFRLYQALLGRTPDPTGFSDWSGMLADGATYAEIIPGFVNSAEFQSRYGALDNTAFVTLLYQNVLNRQPDPAGLQHWLNLLSNGFSRTDVAGGFVESAELISSSADGLNTFLRNSMSSRVDILNGGAGNDVLFGGRGTDTFVFKAADDGADVLYGLQRADRIELLDFGYGSPSQFAAHLSQDGRDVVFSDQGITIRFVNATIELVTSVASFTSSAEGVPFDGKDIPAAEYPEIGSDMAPLAMVVAESFDFSLFADLPPSESLENPNLATSVERLFVDRPLHQPSTDLPIDAAYWSSIPAVEEAPFAASGDLVDSWTYLS